MMLQHSSTSTHTDQYGRYDGFSLSASSSASFADLSMFKASLQTTVSSPGDRAPSIAGLTSCSARDENSSTHSGDDNLGGITTSSNSSISSFAARTFSDQSIGKMQLNSRYNDSKTIENYALSGSAHGGRMTSLPSLQFDDSSFDLHHEDSNESNISLDYQLTDIGSGEFDLSSLLISTTAPSSTKPATTAAVPKDLPPPPGLTIPTH
jgi:hypothetical protein